MWVLLEQRRDVLYSIASSLQILWKCSHWSGCGGSFLRARGVSVLNYIFPLLPPRDVLDIYAFRSTTFIHDNASFDPHAGFIKGAESIPVLISIPLTGFLNDASLTTGKAGYYICSALTAISAVLMFFIGYPKNSAKYSANGWVWYEQSLIKPHNLRFHRSIVSHFNNGASTECGSSFRCNNQWSQAYYPSTECATATPHHHHHYPPQYNQQFSAAATPIRYNCRATIPPHGHGRLQKSLSFAFQTPAMMNEMCHQSYQNQSNSINYPERSYSRWWAHYINHIIAHFILVSFVLRSFADVICTTRSINMPILPTPTEWTPEVEAFQKA